MTDFIKRADKGAKLTIADHDSNIDRTPNLNGRAGGQTLTGGTGSGEQLTLRSTAHASKGVVEIQDSLAVPHLPTTDPAINHRLWSDQGALALGNFSARRVPFVSVTGNRTLALTDANSELVVDSGSARTVTIPANASVAFPTGTKVSVLRLGAGAVNVTAASGVTLNGVSAGSSALNARYSAAVITKVATNGWVINGDMGIVS